MGQQRKCARPCRVGWVLALGLIMGILHAGPVFAITINEILFSPRPGGPNLEFVELYNEASEPVDVSNFFFVRGIDYTIPYPTFIKGKGYLVVAGDPEALKAAQPLLETDNPKYPKVVGPFTGKLDDAGETVALANPAGAEVAKVRYNNRGSWPAEAEKTGHSLILLSASLDGSEGKSWRRSPIFGGSPGFANFGESVFEETEILSDAETWKYLKGWKALETDPDPPSVPIEAWRAPDFDDVSWSEGPMGIGYDTPPLPEFRTAITDMENRYISMFFRKSFDVSGTADMDQLILRIGYDDGFVAYLNGMEVARKNMRVGFEKYSDRAVGSAETKVGDAREVFDITSFVKNDTLKVGRNVLALQVHNSTMTSNDFGVLPSLVYRTEKIIGGDFTEVPVRVNELSSSDPANRWLELYNEGNAGVDLSGYFISNDPADLAMFRIPAGTVIPAEGFVVFTEEELAPGGVTLILPEGVKSLWIGLGRPDMSQVVDAYAFKPPAVPGVSEARYPDGDRKWVAARTPTPAAPNQFQVETDIVINEIMYNPYHPFGDFSEPGSIYLQREDQGEYIEIFNRGSRTISLAGWSLAEAVDFAFPEISMGPGEHLVIAKDPEWLADHYGLDRSRVLGPYYNLTENEDGQIVADPARGFLANDVEEIELLDELGNEADEVPYADSGNWPVWTDGRGSSLELVDPFQDNSEAGAWDASDESGKAEWTHYSYNGVNGATAGQSELKLMLLTMGIVLIDNLSIKDPTNPAVENFVPYGTFDAPHQPTDILYGGNHVWTARTTADVKDGAGALRLVSTGRGNNRADRVEMNTFNPALPLGRSLLVEFDAKWVCGEGVLLTAGYNHTMAKSHFITIPTRLGTPGRENSVRVRLAGKNLGPIISDVRHSPALPPPLAPVNIRARVSDSDGIASAAVEWRLDEVAETGISTLPLHDDGQHEDGRAGDGVYGAQIPGQSLNKIVVFRIVAQDAAGNPSKYPFDPDVRSYPLKSSPVNLLPAASRANPPSKNIAYQHVNYTPDPVRSYRIIFPRENWAYLQGRPIMSNDLVDATFVYNDSEAYHNVGVRFGNSPWTRGGYSPNNQSYRVKFGKDRTFHGWRKFKIDNQRNENLMDERVAWYLFQGNASHMPGSSPCYLEHLYCQAYVSFNSSQTKLAHIYDHIEVPAAPFLGKWWPGDSDGVLYKMDDRFEVDDSGNRSTNIDGRLLYPPVTGSGADKESYRWFFMHRARDKFDDYSELMAAAQLIDSRRTPAPEFNARLFQEFNVEQMARTWAMSINIDDWDTWGTTRGKNCYLYRTRIDGRWNLIPWDKDLIFGNVSGLPIVPGNHSEVARILSSPNGKRVYFNVLRGMVDTFWTSRYVSDYFSEVAKVAPVGMIGSPLRGAGFVTNRANTIKSALGAAVVTFEITSPAVPEVAQEQPSIVVAGNAPYGVWYIELKLNSGATELLDHADGGLGWVSTKWTTRPISLSAGINDLTFVAFDGAGNVVGQDSVKVTVGGEPPFVRGDTDRNDAINLTDGIVILNHLFRGELVTNCHDALDTDDTGILDLTDAVFLLQHLFQGGEPPPAPYPDPGFDSTPDDLEGCR